MLLIQLRGWLKGSKPWTRGCKVGRYSRPARPRARDVSRESKLWENDCKFSWEVFGSHPPAPRASEAPKDSRLQKNDCKLWECRQLIILMKFQPFQTVSSFPLDLGPFLAAPSLDLVALRAQAGPTDGL